MTEPYAASPRPRDSFRAVAAGVSAVQALALFGFCGFYLWELAQAGGDDAARVVMSAVLIAVFGVGLVMLTLAWWAGANWPNTPTVVWNLLLVPVAWSLLQSDRALLAALVGIVAVTGVVAAVGAHTAEPEDIEG